MPEPSRRTRAVSTSELLPTDHLRGTTTRKELSNMTLAIGLPVGMYQESGWYMGKCDPRFRNPDKDISKTACYGLECGFRN